MSLLTALVVCAHRSSSQGYLIFPHREESGEASFGVPVIVLIGPFRVVAMLCKEFAEDGIEVLVLQVDFDRQWHLGREEEGALDFAPVFIFRR